MVMPVDFSLPADAHLSYYYVAPIVVVLAFEALAYLLPQVTQSLKDRVQPPEKPLEKPGENPEKLQQEGWADYQNELYDEAIEKFTLALECNPDRNLHLLILDSRATAQIKIGRSESALNDFQLALARDLEEDQRLHFQMSFLLCQAAVFTKNNEYKKAMENYTKALECVSQDLRGRAHILYLRSHVYGRLKKFDLCECDITNAILCDSGEDRIQLFGARAVARVALKKYPEAIEDLTTAIDINPADEEWKAELLYIRGVAQRENKNPDLARQNWEAALKCNFKKEGLRESIEGQLYPKKAQSVGTISALLGSVAFNLPGVFQK
jgi:tetratricopeptide (TPR) repeat protein